MAKVKYVTFECSHCHKHTKLEILGSSNGTQRADGKIWYRCTRCKHSFLLHPETIEKAKNELKAAIDREKCTVYRNDATYTIGQAIYHSEWDDVGRVIKKEKTSSGIQTIVVAFEKLGEKRLIENMAVDISEETSII